MTKDGKYEGDGSFCTAAIDGDDVVVRGVRCTWFGGANDPDDSGETASGVSTKRNPNFLGCALPMWGKEPACKGSPFKYFPWHTLVRVYNRQTGAAVVTELIDVGPAKRKDGAQQGCIDLTQAAMRKICGGMRPSEAVVDFRVIGGAKYMGK